MCCSQQTFLHHHRAIKNVIKKIISLALSLSLSLQHHAHSRKGNVFVCVVWKVGRSRVLGDLMEFLFDSELVVVFHFHN